MQKYLKWTVTNFKKSIFFILLGALSGSLYASDICPYSDFDVSTLPDDPMQAIHAFKTIGTNLTLMSYSFKNQPAVQIINLIKITDNYFEILTERDIRDQKYIALDIIENTAPKEYLQIRVVGKTKPAPASSIKDNTSFPELQAHVKEFIVAPNSSTITVNNLVRFDPGTEKRLDKVHLTQIFPHWIKISLLCRNSLLSQKERLLAEVHYTKNKNGWTKTSHIHIYPINHPMVKNKK